MFYPMSRTNETRNITWHENCTNKCRLDLINNFGIVINAGVNAKNWLIKIGMTIFLES